MSAPHTPGPWSIDGQADEKGNWKVADEGGNWVARVHFRDTTPSAARASIANAQLIASAPDLLIALEALRVATAALAERIDEEMDLDRDDKPNWAMRLGAEFGGMIGNALNAADAATAKARPK